MVSFNTSASMVYEGVALREFQNHFCRWLLRERIRKRQ
jgi:hypothetical protein